MQEVGKRGQVAIFVIIAVVIVGAILAFYFSQRASIISTSNEDPNSFLRDCISPTLKSALSTITKQGGENSPSNYVIYQGDKIQYLCYTSENYKPCIVQQPRLVSHVEDQLKSLVGVKAAECLSSMKAEYERKGYQVGALPAYTNASIVPGSINVNFNSAITLTKEGTQNYKAFAINVPSQLYYLLTTATSIISFESKYGDSEITSYLQYYPDLRIEKVRRESDTIYIITNVVSKEQFVFATRSLVWPQGYGVNQ